MHVLLFQFGVIVKCKTRKIAGDTNIFGEGNVGTVFEQFPEQHVCNTCHVHISPVITGAMGGVLRSKLLGAPPKALRALFGLLSGNGARSARKKMVFLRPDKGLCACIGRE